MAIKKTTSPETNRVQQLKLDSWKTFQFNLFLFWDHRHLFDCFFLVKSFQVIVEEPNQSNPTNSGRGNLIPSRQGAIIFTQKRMWKSHSILHRRRATASTSGGK